MTEFDRQKCQQRNRIAARRDGVEATPLQVFSAAPVVEQSRLRYAHGTLPATMEQALERINTTLPDGGTPLTADDVYIHYFEAANSNFVGDRYMFMDGSTLRNIAQDATAGVAFMNSHRDGGLSHPADLPMGRTFAGRYEELSDGSKRALGGFYMLRGIQPNGQSGPSTDDLHRMIGGGTAFDVSVGLYSGDKICDVCGRDMEADGWRVADEDEEANTGSSTTQTARCPHVPGTQRGMKRNEVDAQTARGVKEGRASYSLVGAHLGEVSAVYDGAVPGAGFRKTLALARRHQLSRADLLQARQAYARLLGKDDLRMDDITEAVAEGVEKGYTRSRRRTRAAREDAPAVLASIEQIALPVVDADRQKFEQERAEFEAQKREFAQQQHWATAERDVERLIKTGKVLPAENLPNGDGHPELTAVLAATLGIDAALYGRVVACFDARQPQVVLGEQLPVVTLTTGPEKAPVDLDARRKELLAASDLGRAVLKQKES
jgi:hypothetical protein